MSQHAVLSPSSAHRRILCPGSLAAHCRSLGLAPGVQAPDSPPSSDSASGTLTHAIAEDCLRNGTKPESYLGRTMEADGFTFVVEQDRVDRVEVYINAIRAHGGILRTEVRLDTSNVLGVPGQGGTGDAVILQPDQHRIIVADLKDGVGVVWAWRDPGEGKARWHGANPQLMEYGAAALDQFGLLDDWKAVRLEIHQPRVDHFDAVTFTVHEVKEWLAHYAHFEQRAYLLWSKETSDADIAANLYPSDKACKWCPINGNCAARASKMLAEFPIAPTFDPLKVTHEQLAEILDRADDVESFFKAARAEALRRALAGNNIPGWKSVQGREGNRKFADPAAAVKLLADKLLNDPVADESVLYRECFTEPELESPTALEKVLKKKAPDVWKDLQPLITRAAPGFSLARDFDKRVAQAPNAVEFGLTTEATPASEGLI